jgi:RNA polymerase sigma-70 factor (ECF subfamily)
MVERYGREIVSFLASVHGSQDAAAEVFAQTCEDLVRSFAQFRAQCSLRTWFYALAKNASRRYCADSFRRRRVAISQAANVVAPARTNTPRFLQTEWKSRLRALRERLDPDDRALLVLRVDRQMAWEDIAHVLDEPACSCSALRKRFERIKAKLRADAARDGWPIEP